MIFTFQLYVISWLHYDSSVLTFSLYDKHGYENKSENSPRTVRSKIIYEAVTNNDPTSLALAERKHPF